jgi:O-antigen ligase
MPPIVALFAWFVFVVYLFRRDPLRDSRVSWAVWIPLIWMLIQGTRLPSQWLNMAGVNAIDVIEDGNPLDRAVYLSLIVLALWVMSSRSVRWGKVIGRNPALTALIVLGLISVTWSDFPYIAFKRWVRDLGTYLMIIAVMSEASPLEAIEKMIRRFCYVTVTLSIVLIKYYPQLGMGYDYYSGAPYTVGVTTNKNMLGVLCLVSALFFSWDILRRFAERKDKIVRKLLVIDGGMLLLTLSVLKRADSSTSLLSYVVALMIMFAARLRWIKESPSRLAIMIPVAAVSIAVIDFLFGIRSLVTSSVGRDTTFTGRTNLWAYLGSLDKNWLLGAGYESFWIGPRLQAAWKIFQWGPTEAHNGYLEMYIQLGVVGLFALALVLMSFYRRIYRELSKNASYAVLCLSFLIVLLIYNYTEAAFRNCLLWFTFLMLNIAAADSGETISVAAKQQGAVLHRMSGQSRIRRRVPSTSN